MKLQKINYKLQINFNIQKSNFKTILIMIVLLVFSVAALAQEKQKEKVVKKQVSFEEISRLALENNLDIQMVKLEILRKRYDLDVTKSIFDTELTLKGEFEKDRFESNSTLAADDTITRTLTAQLEKKLPTGTTLEITLKSEREKTNSDYVRFNPVDQAMPGVSLTQEISRNFFGLQDRIKVKVSKLDIEMFEWASLDDIETKLAISQKTYWNFVYQYQELKLREEILGKAKDMYALYQKRFNNGLVEEPDLLAMQANVEIKEEELLIAQLNLLKAETTLLFLLDQSNFSVSLEPKDNLEATFEFCNKVEQLKSAFNTRRDYKKQKSFIEKTRLEVISKANSLWPQIDLKATYARNGLDDTISSAWSKADTQNRPYFYAGVSITTTLERNDTRAQLNQAKLDKRNALLKLQNIEHQIMREIFDVVNEINIFALEVAANRKIVDLQERKLAAEEKRLKFGRSSSDILIRYQEDALDAELNLLRSQLEYRTALIDLVLKKNVLLEKYWKDKI